MTGFAVELLSDFHFLRPWWFAALPLALLPVLARRAEGTGGWHRVVAPELLTVLLDGGDAGHRRARATFHGVAATAFCLAVCALAGPTLERLPQPVATHRDAMVIVLDLSTSMYARDTPPSRIARAHAEVARMLGDREEGLTGLVVYAGDAHVVTPLTDDVRNIENLLPALVPTIMPVPGSRPGPALAAARELFPNVGATEGHIVLLTDGVEDADAVLLDRDPSFPVSIIGIGTPEGAPIPLDFRGVPGRFLADETGALVRTRLDAPRLAELARDSYGAYRTHAPDGPPGPWPKPLPPPAATPGEETFDDWHDLGFWLVLPVLALACLGFRRGVLAMLACVLLLPVARAEPPDAPGEWSLENLWERPDQRAYRLLRAGRADAAAELFEDPRWRAVAHYRGGDIEGAAERFRGDDTPTGQYNLGNALARLGALEAAIGAYERVLAAVPDHADARHNRGLVAQLLEARAGESDNDAQNPDVRGGSGGSPSAATAPESITQDTTADPDAPPLAGTTPEGNALDARERWLESVPDDPGGLLRRKFRHETNQRLREGDYSSRARGPTW